MSDPKLEEIAEAVAGKRCEYRGPGIVGPCAEFHEVCAATQRTNTLAILAALREAAEAARREEREALREWIAMVTRGRVLDENLLFKADVLEWFDARSRAEKPKV